MTKQDEKSLITKPLANRWLILFGILLVGLVIGIIGVWVPAVIRKIGLYSVMIGLLIALVANQSYSRLNLPMRKIDLICVSLIAICSEVLRCWESFRQSVLVQQSELKKQIQPELFVPPDLLNSFSITFETHLQSRLEGLGQISIHWAWSIWIAELILAGGTAMLSLFWFHRITPSPTDQEL